jgi:hypothetical protein
MSPASEQSWKKRVRIPSGLFHAGGSAWKSSALGCSNASLAASQESLTMALLKELVEPPHQLILVFLLVHRRWGCLPPGAGGPQGASGFILDYRLARLTALLEGVKLIVKSALHVIDQERYC